MTRAPHGGGKPASLLRVFRSNFAVAHATVLALVVGVFLMDGCAHRQPDAPLNAPDAPAPTAKGSRP